MVNGTNDWGGPSVQAKGRAAACGRHGAFGYWKKKKTFRHLKRSDESTTAGSIIIAFGEAIGGRFA